MPETRTGSSNGRDGVDLGTVQQLLCDVLCLPLREVRLKASFLELGGDSVTALEFGARCSTMNIRVQVGDILESASLNELAARMAYRTETRTSIGIKAWSLGPALGRDGVERDIREQCQLSAAGHEISDVYPATALQEGLMALAVKQAGSYISEYQFALTSEISIDRFKAAWEQVLQACPILRTRIVLIGGRSWQAVILEDPHWESLPLGKDEQVDYGSSLCQYALHAHSTGHRFHLRMHHAIFDGWCLGLLSETLAQCYYDRASPGRSLVPFVNFVDYALSIDMQASHNYWKTQLRAAKRTVFPSLHRARPSVTAAGSATSQHQIRLSSRAKSVTMATILRAAWAMVLAAYDDRAEDVTFGSTVAGRQVPIDRIEHIAGPVISTVPVRVKLDQKQSVLQFLQGMQMQATAMIPFEQLGLQNIAKLGVDEQEACKFSTLLVVQPHGIWARANNSLLTIQDSAIISYEVNNAKYFNYPLVLQTHMYDDMIVLHITHDTSVLCTEQIERMAIQYEHVVQQLLLADVRGDPTQALDSVTLCGTRDVEEVRSWNTDVQTEVVSSCFHTMVEVQAKKRPLAPAISAWDGEFSYSELNAAADRLAHHLVASMGVATGDLVILCFEKSAWAYVAMLAVNKAGGAWVPLDPSHPPRRHQQVISQAGARVALHCDTSVRRQCS
nr:nonribosomal peptide synthetase tes [Quercus suber]